MCLRKCLLRMEDSMADYYEIALKKHEEWKGKNQCGAEGAFGE